MAIHIPKGTDREDSYWSPYMANLLREAVADWIVHQETQPTLSPEHVRIAKDFVS